ncbi:MAG: serine/threonine protein kinase [Polyangiaceae bacterium]|nr:serine/threonine protein kinase [Polyangiaceae bacterium]
MSSASEDRAVSPKRLRLGAYELLFDLATGGMATVALARQVGDAGFERLVALKRVHAHLLADPEVFAMASDEARLAALIRHPNVVPVISVLDTGGELVLVQDFVEGASLSTLLRRLAKAGKRLEPAVAVKIAVDALRGLHAAHEVKDLRGEPLDLVHRDVSPQNLLVGADGTTRVIDFGIARAARRMALTRTGVVKGKIQYMAPEQIEDKSIDRRADVFALGAVLYEALAGVRPFGDGDDAAIMGRLLLGEVDMAPIDARAPSLRELVSSALARDPDQRPRTALELAKGLSRALAPADEEDVRAAVELAIGPELEEQRARIRSALGDEQGEGDEPSVATEGPTLEPTSGPKRSPKPPLAAGRARGRWGLAFAALLVGGAAAVAVAFGGRDERASPSRTPPLAPSAAPTAASRATAETSLASSRVASSTEAPTTVTPDARGAGSPGAATTAAPTSASTRMRAPASSPAAASSPSALTSAPSPELLPSPYRR